MSCCSFYPQMGACIMVLPHFMYAEMNLFKIAETKAAAGLKASATYINFLMHYGFYSASVLCALYKYKSLRMKSGDPSFDQQSTSSSSSIVTVDS
ncbi:hypothetical protein WN944_024341 [Citrus x changshan-huyou]|uniref:Uncharacterized protein n=1 Tax=Citrus x changshan-huyou TaxID=2935761 RepID=A0AAP0QBZ4_9ROSI